MHPAERHGGAGIGEGDASVGKLAASVGGGWPGGGTVIEGGVIVPSG